MSGGAVSAPGLRGRLLALPLLLAVAVALGASGSARADSSVAYQIDMARSGHQAADGLTPPLQRAWTYMYSQPPVGAAHVSYPLIAANRVFVTASYSDVYFPSTVTALDLATGKPIWGPLAIGGDGGWSGLVYDGGKLFTLADDGTVAAFDPVHGAILWTAKIGVTAAEPAAANGVLYLVDDGGMWGLNESNGHTMWHNPFPHGVRSTPAVAGGLAYFSTGPQSADAVDPGGHVWWWRTPYAGGGQTVAVHDGKLYVRDATGT
jgi:outer membrane protein assembly factor BamB